MPNMVEGYRLFKRALFQTHLAAQRSFATYQEILTEFNLRKKSILELGAGSRGGLTMLFDSTNEVIGIDRPPATFIEDPWASVKARVQALLFDPLYFTHLRRLNVGQLIRRQILYMDAARLEFPNDHFDFVYSRYVLEHIEDLETVAKEMHRCLKPGGVTFHRVGLFTLLDGAHTQNWKAYLPWHHLLSEVASNVYINRHRLSTYQEVFCGVFDPAKVTVRWTISMEAAKLLTPEREKALSGYTREELTASDVEIIAVK